MTDSLHPSGHIPTECHFATSQVGSATLMEVQAIELPSGPALEDFEAKLTVYIKEHRPKQLVLDFHMVRFMSSETLRSLLHVREQLQARGGRLHLCNLQPLLRQVFRLTHLDKLFPLFDSREAALDAF